MKCTFLHLESVSRHDACSVSHELALDATAEEEETLEILQGEFLLIIGQSGQSTKFADI